MSHRTSDGKNILDINIKIEGNNYFEAAEAFTDIKNQLLSLREEFCLADLNWFQSRLLGVWDAKTNFKSCQKRLAQNVQNDVTVDVQVEDDVPVEVDDDVPVEVEDDVPADVLAEDDVQVEDDPPVANRKRKNIEMVNIQQIIK